MNIYFVISLLLLLRHKSDETKGQMLPVLNGEKSETKFPNDYIDNEIDIKITYKSGIERLLQGLIRTIDTYRAAFARSSRALTPWLPAERDSDGGGFGDILNQFREDFQAVFPGTLWCGDGNVARSNDDIGFFAQTDACCREHDNCPYNIEAGQRMGPLKNNGIFTRSACSCDFEFYKCLKSVNTVVSANIGATYFNILRPQCFGYHHPIEACEKYDNVRLLDKKCYQYKLNHSRNKTLEWYDLPDF